MSHLQVVPTYQHLLQPPAGVHTRHGMSSIREIPRFVVDSVSPRAQNLPKSLHTPLCPYFKKYQTLATDQASNESRRKNSPRPSTDTTILRSPSPPLPPIILASFRRLELKSSHRCRSTALPGIHHRSTPLPFIASSCAVPTTREVQAISDQTIEVSLEPCVASSTYSA
jgi:hypothetical protein